MTKITWTLELDTSGLLCPLPVLKARKKLKGMKTGEVLRLIADDPAALIDVEYYCKESGQKLLEQSLENKHQVYLIKKLV